jgi:hypothetical protein
LPLVLSGSILSGNIGTTLGNGVQGVGDLDQDGYADFFVSDGVVGSAYLFRGGSNSTAAGTDGGIDSDGGIDASPIQQFSSSSFLARAGDLNGDGFDDAAFVTHVKAASVWVSDDVNVIWGSSALDQSTAQQLFTVSKDQPVTDLVGGRDVDGDGLPELLVGMASLERVVVIRGSKSFPVSTQFSDFSAFLAPSFVTDFNYGQAVGLGDYNGDGLFDAAIGLGTNRSDPWHSGAAWLTPGTPNFSVTNAVKSVPLSTTDKYAYGGRIAH